MHWGSWHVIFNPLDFQAASSFELLLRAMPLLDACWVRDHCFLKRRPACKRTAMSAPMQDLDMGPQLYAHLV